MNFQNPPNGNYRPTIDADGQSHDVFEEEQEDADPGYMFLEQFNVWGVGKLMYDLATLSYPDEYRRRWAASEEVYHQNGRDVLGDYQTAPFRFSTGMPDAQNPYSRDLMDLISQCLRPSIEDRIELGDLYSQVQNHLHHFDTSDSENEDGDDDNSPNDNDDQSNKKLYFKDNEINAMPLGNAPFTTEASEYLRVLEETVGDDPNWQELQLPPNAYQERVAHLRARWRRRRNRFKVVNGRIHFQRMIRPAPRGGLVHINYSESSGSDDDDDNDRQDKPSTTQRGTRGSGSQQADPNGEETSNLDQIADAARLLQSVAEDIERANNAGGNNANVANAPRRTRAPMSDLLLPPQRPYNRRGVQGRGFVGINYGRGYGRGRGGVRKNGRRYP